MFGLTFLLPALSHDIFVFVGLILIHIIFKACFHLFQAVAWGQSFYDFFQKIEFLFIFKIVCGVRMWIFIELML